MLLFSQSILNQGFRSNYLRFFEKMSHLANVKVRISFGDKNISNSRSNICFISTAVMESIPISANVECKLTVFKSVTPDKY